MKYTLATIDPDGTTTPVPGFHPFPRDYVEGIAKAQSRPGHEVVAVPWVDRLEHPLDDNDGQ